MVTGYANSKVVRNVRKVQQDFALAMVVEGDARSPIVTKVQEINSFAQLMVEENVARFPTATNLQSGAQTCAQAMGADVDVLLKVAINLHSHRPCFV